MVIKPEKLSEKGNDSQIILMKTDTKNLNKIYHKSNKQRTLTKYITNQIQQHVNNNSKIVHHDQVHFYPRNTGEVSNQKIIQCNSPYQQTKKTI